MSVSRMTVAATLVPLLAGGCCGPCFAPCSFIPSSLTHPESSGVYAFMMLRVGMSKREISRAVGRPDGTSQTDALLQYRLKDRSVVTISLTSDDKLQSVTQRTALGETFTWVSP